MTEAGAEPLHTDAEGLGSWAREIADVEIVYHLGLPRIEPPLRRAGARRRARLAATGAAALRAAVGDRPVVMASTGLLYGAAGAPAVDDDPAHGRLALAQAARRAEAELEGPGLRVVRLPWVYGPTGLMRDLIVGLRTRRYRVVGPGDNPWSLLAVDDAASALVAAAGGSPGDLHGGRGGAPDPARRDPRHLPDPGASPARPRGAGARRHRHGRRDEPGPRGAAVHPHRPPRRARLGAGGRLAPRPHAAGGGPPADAGAVSGIDWVRVPSGLS